MFGVPQTWRFLLVAAVAGVAKAHTVITYPGWRGDNLQTNDEFPFGMQWSYPCGGIPPTDNRTNWPITGGAIAIQPGWFRGHKNSLIYINLGLGTDGPGGGPPNMSFPMTPVFQIRGPSDNPYPGTFCLPQVPLPENVSVKVGDLATIQVIETLKHGGALYNCVDIIFSELEDVAEVTASNCFNSTDIDFSYVYSVPTQLCGPDTNLIDRPTADPASATNSRAQLFASSTPTGTATCPPCPTQTQCPSTNGMGNSLSGRAEGMGVGFPLGVLALGALGL
ncbi:hypothetical protein ONS95_000232 [Cadophora gregata]|uniref:uncharacterized protein n=1 Tax=Cadophora gregata TaxID=51156 RepID=UPI0026DD49EB|nr:uncharacterized protein ONS95_000232 [Cadophora gregata]KAK0099502.1 hypothetical protein ONS96_008338 [Cadophora gregata f. sp. sojae]KAK0128256.1 hypothetical protein ONS95_000232 [Cadophora gregata]